LSSLSHELNLEHFNHAFVDWMLIVELTNNIKGVAQYTINLFCIGVKVLIMFVDYYEIFIVYYWSLILSQTRRKLNNKISKPYEQKQAQL
jgi:hypothetical protein